VKAEKVRELSVSDLKGKQKELQEQLFRLRLQKSIGQLDSGLRIRQTRRQIARVLTILREKTAGARGAQG
jgi:large subunit ribosomal protein L29